GGSVQLREISDNSFIIVTSYELIENIIQLMLKELKDFNGNTSDSIKITILNDKIAIGKAFIINQNTIQLTLTAKIDPASGILPGNYVINGQRPQEVAINDNEYEITLSLSKSLLLVDSVSVEVLYVK